MPDNSAIFEEDKVQEVRYAKNDKYTGLYIEGWR